MARVMGRAASATARRTPSRAVQRRARRHKVIMESVTQEKKKLRSVVCIPCFEMSSSILINQICFEAQAPSGYTFIPAGNPQLTTACKERCRKEGLQIHAVSVRILAGRYPPQCLYCLDHTTPQDPQPVSACSSDRISLPQHCGGSCLLRAWPLPHKHW